MTLANCSTSSAAAKSSSGDTVVTCPNSVNELLGADLPIVAAPCVKSVLRAHPAYARNLQLLSSTGVQILDSDAITSRGPDGLATFDWNTVITEFLQAV